MATEGRMPVTAWCRTLAANRIGCAELLSKQKIEPFLPQFPTGMEQDTIRFHRKSNP